MAIVTGTILVTLFTLFASIGKWLVEFAYMYGRKVLIFTVTVSLFFASLLLIATFITSSIDTVSTGATTSAMSQYMTLTVAVFPSNFSSILTLILSIEFQIFFWKWANKVLNMKVDIFA